MTIAIGTKLGRYEIRSKIGEGGMGEVYLAHDTKLDRKVALKILPTAVVTNQDRMRRFVQEAKAASALNHPNIITIHEIDETDSAHFIATEFIEGETLREHMRRTGMKISEVLDVSTQIGSALAAAHAAGIIHRDIKPENVMIRRDGIMKVLDFGLAKLSEPEPADVVDTEAPTRAAVNTEPGQVIGTACYMSPEQARGIDVDARTDIFSLGVLVYEMVAGRLPFVSSNTNEILASILSDKELPPLARYAREVPDELERIVEKALAKNREERYQNTKDLLVDLRRLKHKLEVEAEIERTVPPSESTATEESVVLASREQSPKTKTLHGEGRTLDQHAASSAEYLVNELKQHKRGAVVMMAVLLLAIAGIIYFSYFARPAAPIDSIAIIPLVNASADPNTEYLSDGITESIISNLSQLSQLKVMARSTVFRFKGKDVDPQKVGHDLGVRAVLTGRLLQQGDRLVIRTELTNVADGAALWGAEYDRKLSDVLAVQQEISREISEKLRLKVTGEEQKRLIGHDTASVEAYQFYLRGRYFWNKRTPDSLNRAIEEFQQAIQRDPNYALGYVGLADCYLLLEPTAGIPSNETLPKARTAVDRALQIDDSLSEAHTSSAFIYAGMWQWTKAEAEFKRAISLNPNYPTVHHWYAFYLMTTRQFDEAWKEATRAHELDPLSTIIGNGLAYTYLCKNDVNSAVEQCQKMIELDPNVPAPHETLGIAYLKEQRDEAALAEFQKEVEISKRSSPSLRALGYFYAVTGNRAEALRIVKELEERYTRRESIGWYIASVYAGLGDRDRAFAWMEKDFQQHSAQLSTITWFFTIGDLRSDPRYADLVRRMGLQP